MTWNSLVPFPTLRACFNCTKGRVPASSIARTGGPKSNWTTATWAGCPTTPSLTSETLDELQGDLLNGGPRVSPGRWPHPETNLWRRRWPQANPTRQPRVDPLHLHVHGGLLALANPRFEPCSSPSIHRATSRQLRDWEWLRLAETRPLKRCQWGRPVPRHPQHRRAQCRPQPPPPSCRRPGTLQSWCCLTQ